MTTQSIILVPAGILGYSLFWRRSRPGAVAPAWYRAGYFWFVRRRFWSQHPLYDRYLLGPHQGKPELVFHDHDGLLAQQRVMVA